MPWCCFRFRKGVDDIFAFTLSGRETFILEFLDWFHFFSLVVFVNVIWEAKWLRWTFRVRLSFYWSPCWTKCHRSSCSNIAINFGVKLKRFKCAAIESKFVDRNRQHYETSVRNSEHRRSSASKSWTFFKLMRPPYWVWIVQTVLRRLSMKIPAIICPKSVSTLAPNSIWISSIIQTIRTLRVATVIPVRLSRPLLHRHHRRHQ